MLKYLLGIVLCVLAFWYVYSLNNEIDELQKGSWIVCKQNDDVYFLCNKCGHMHKIDMNKVNEGDKKFIIPHKCDKCGCAMKPEPLELNF